MTIFHVNQCNHCGQETTHSADEVCLRCGNENPPDNYTTMSTDDYKTISYSIESHLKQCIGDCNELIDHKRRTPWTDIKHTLKLVLRAIDLDRHAETIINEQKTTSHN